MLLLVRCAVIVCYGFYTFVLLLILHFSSCSHQMSGPLHCVSQNPRNRAGKAPDCSSAIQASFLFDGKTPRDDNCSTWHTSLYYECASAQKTFVPLQEMLIILLTPLLQSLLQIETISTTSPAYTLTCRSLSIDLCNQLAITSQKGCCTQIPHGINGFLKLDHVGSSFLDHFSQLTVLIHFWKVITQCCEFGCSLHGIIRAAKLALEEQLTNHDVTLFLGSTKVHGTERATMVRRTIYRQLESVPHESIQFDSNQKSRTPPINSPQTNSCGMVGHCENSLIPCRIFASAPGAAIKKMCQYKNSETVLLTVDGPIKATKQGLYIPIKLAPRAPPDYPAPRETDSAPRQ